jgi:hypothetical protein
VPQPPGARGFCRCAIEPPVNPHPVRRAAGPTSPFLGEVIRA